jgi:hypothetical protein
VANTAFAIATLHRPMRGFLKTTDAVWRQRRSPRASAAATKAKAIIAMAKLKARTKRAPKPTPTDCAGIDESLTEELPPG